MAYDKVVFLILFSIVAWCSSLMLGSCAPSTEATLCPECTTEDALEKGALSLPDTIVERLRRLGTFGCEAPWFEEHWRDDGSSYASFVWCAERFGEVPPAPCASMRAIPAAYLRASVSDGAAGCVRIADFTVQPDYEEQCVGRWIIHRVSQESLARGRCVRVHDQSTRIFERLGFVQTSPRSEWWEIDGSEKLRAFDCP